jgi:hypothetical protein
VGEQIGGELRALAPVAMGDEGLELVDGVEAKPSSSISSPFASLVHRYGDDLAILWINSHPRHRHSGQPVPRRDPDILELLPATVTPDRVALVGLHEWTEDDFPDVAAWGIRSFSPDDVRS